MKPREVTDEVRREEQAKPARSVGRAHEKAENILEVPVKPARSDGETDGMV
jgi:tellurite resistance protein